MTRNENSPMTSSAPAMPGPATYEEEYDYFPWGQLLKQAEERICMAARPNATILDYMCGTGYLLSRVSRRRPDLHLFGCSLIEQYIEYGAQRYSGVTLACCDVFDYVPPR